MPFMKPNSLPSPQNFWLKHLLPAVIFAVLMMFVYTQTSWDVDLSNLFYNAQTHTFPLRRNALLSQFMHTGLKWLVVGIALTSLALWGMSYRFSKLQPVRKPLLWTFIAMVASTSIVAAIKHKSMHGCPWDLLPYGGELPLFGLFETPPIGAEAGGCFPAGHPSAGYALMAFYFAYRGIKPRFAATMLWSGIIMGLIMGWAQVMRGAHFLSHILWSGWVVWLVLLMLYWAWPPYKTNT